MSLKLRDLIRQVRACKTAAEERAVIAKESAMIRTAIREEQEHYRHRNVAKLLFMHMLGYPTHFGQLECLKLIASPHFPEKRIGYLGLMLLLSEETEVLMLATNALKNDLNADNKFVAGLALTAVGNLATADMSRDLVPEVDKHLGSHTPYLRKKACLAMSRCLVKVPEMVEDFVERVCGLLKDRSHGVLICVVQLMTQMLIGTRPPDADDEAALHHYHSEEEEEAARADLEAKAETHEAVRAAFVDLVPQLVKLLRNLLSMGYSPEHDVGGISDPFLQVQILVVLRLVGHDDAETSELMNDVLAQVATNTETSKNAGNAILYEVVQTIMAVEAEDGLRVLAVNILGRFLLNRDNNIRYVALNTLSSSVVGRDTAAVQRHRGTIVDCLKDPDVSIRQRALELIYHLVNADNVETLTAELLNYLVVCPRDHRAEICTRVLRVVEKYSPNDRWRVDTLITMLTIAGRECDEEVRNVAIVYVSRSSEDLRAYATHKLLKALRDDDGSQRGLLVVAIWCIGEYADLVLKDYTYTPSPRPKVGGEAEGEQNGEAAADFTDVPVPITFMGLEPADVVRTVEEVTKRHSCPEEVRQRAITCFAKLSDRFSSLPPGNEDVKAKLKTLVDMHRGSHSLELQLRSCEYGALMAAASGISPAGGGADDAFGGGTAVSEKTSGAARDALARMPVVDLEVVQRKQRLAATDDKGELLVEDVFASDNNADGDNGKKAAGGGGDSLIDLESIFGGGAPPAGDAAAVRQSTQKQNGAGGAASTASATGANTPSNDVDLLADIFSAPPAAATAASSVPAPAPFDPFSAPPQQQQQQQQQGGGGMDMFNPQPTPAAAQATAGGNMGDLFGGGGGGGPQVASNPEPSNPVVQAFAKDGLEIDFECTKADGGIDPQKSEIVAKFRNTTSTPLVGMNLQCAVPKYVTMEILPPTSTTIPPSAQMGAKQVTQTIRVTNTMLGTKKLLMKLKVAFTVQGGKKVEHMSSFSGFPEGY